MATDKAHSSAARKKATATYADSRAFAARYGATAGEFPTGEKLKQFMQKHGIALIDVPPSLRVRLGKRALKMMNGHTPPKSIGIPLDAIPAKAERKPGSGSYERKTTRGHPNAELIGKIVDLLANPQTNDKVSERLLIVLEKLLG